LDVEIWPVRSLTTEDTEGHGGLQEEVLTGNYSIL